MISERVCQLTLGDGGLGTPHAKLDTADLLESYLVLDCGVAMFAV